MPGFPATAMIVKSGAGGGGFGREMGMGKTRKEKINESKQHKKKEKRNREWVKSIQPSTAPLNREVRRGNTKKDQNGKERGLKQEKIVF